MSYWKQSRFWLLLILALLFTACTGPADPETKLSGVIPDKPWVTSGEQVQIDLQGTATAGGSLSSAVDRVLFDGKAVAFSEVDGSSIRFTVPENTSSGAFDVAVESSGDILTKKVHIPGDDLIKGEAMFVVKSTVQEAALASSLNGLGFTLTSFDPLGSSDASSLCSGTLATVSYDNAVALSEAVLELSTSLTELLFDLGKLGNIPDDIPLNVIDPKSGYSVRTAGHLETIGATSARARNLTGKGTTIAVLDTGVNAHDELEGRLLAGQDFVNDDNSPSDDYDDDTTTVKDGHGTAIAVLAAGTTYGVAPAAEVMPVRVCDANGNCDSSDVVRGMCYALNNAAPDKLIINLSLGGETPPFIPEYILYEAMQKRTLIAAAAGNRGDGGSPKHYPAAYNLDGVVVAAALDKSNTGAAAFSNAGTYIDVAAPGTGLESGAADGGFYGGYQGTSFSTALVAGALALWREAQPEAKPETIEQGIRDSAKALAGTKPVDVGQGMLDLSVKPEGGKTSAPAIERFEANPAEAAVNAPITFSWKITEPNGGAVSCTLIPGDGSESKTIADCLATTSAQHSYAAEGAFTASLVAKNKDGETRATKRVTTSTNPPPVANAGVDQTVAIGSAVTLSGAGSSDPNDNELSYAWTLKPPTGSTATLSAADTVTPSFTPDIEGQYTATLNVSNGTASASDEVVISAQNIRVCPDSYTIDDNDTQGDINAVQGCGIISGSLSVRTSELTGLTLENLTVVRGSLALQNNGALTSLSLPALQTVDGALTLINNGKLETLTLPALQSTGANLTIQRSAELESVSFAKLSSVGNNLYVQGNPDLASLDLDALTTTGGYLLVDSNTSLETIQLDSLQTVGTYLTFTNLAFRAFALPELSTVTNYISFASNSALVNLDMVKLSEVGESLRLQQNTALRTVKAEALSALGQDLYLFRNSVLSDLDLGKLSSVRGNVYLNGNGVLSSLDLGSLESVGGYVQLIDNDTLPELELVKLSSVGGEFRLSGNNLLKSVTTALETVGGDLAIYDNDALEQFTSTSLVSVNRSLLIQFNKALESVTLANLEELGGNLYVYTNAALASVSLAKLPAVPNGYVNFGRNGALTAVNLSRLETVDTYVQFDTNAALTTLSLPSLVSVGSYVSLDANEALESVSLTAETIGGNLLIGRHAKLTGVTMSNLESIGGAFTVRYNEALASIGSFPSLTRIGAELFIFENASLKSLDGLSALESIGGTKTISNNAEFDCSPYDANPGEWAFIPADASARNRDDCLTE